MDQDSSAKRGEKQDLGAKCAENVFAVVSQKHNAELSETSSSSLRFCKHHLFIKKPSILECSHNKLAAKIQRNSSLLHEKSIKIPSLRKILHSAFSSFIHFLLFSSSSIKFMTQSKRFHALPALEAVFIGLRTSWLGTSLVRVNNRTADEAATVHLCRKTLENARNYFFRDTRS